MRQYIIQGLYRGDLHGRESGAANPGRHGGGGGVVAAGQSGRPLQDRVLQNFLAAPTCPCRLVVLSPARQARRIKKVD